jgi:hypothetical protein
MQKIVTHPLYIRCKKVFESCKTKEQINTAINYWKLASIRSKDKGAYDLPFEVDHSILWDRLLREVKWN